MVFFILERVCEQVTDGIASSEPAVLRVAVIPLVLRVINNTGIMVPHYSYTLITLNNLTVTTNSDEPVAEIGFKVSAAQFNFLLKNCS